MAYSYYQQYSPTSWGTNRFQFGAPPVPTFAPQSSWGGVDFYRAHAPSSDISLFDHAWNRVRDYHDYDSHGVGVNEARHWHSRAYGGMGDLGQMLPQEIGHAAAYEAYRTWIHNTSMYEPLNGDRERQREGMIGLAVAEAARLLQYSPRGMDAFTRQEAAEAAAATASELYYSSRDRRDGDYRGRSRSHRGSYDDEYHDPYSYDSDLMFSRRGRSRSRYGRSRSRSSYHHSIGVPSVHGSTVGYGAYPNQYAMSGSSYVPTSTPMVMGSSYYSNGYGSGYAARPRSSSVGYSSYYPQTQYVTSGGVSYVPSGHGSNQVVLYTKPKKKHSWYRSRSKHRRSRSRSWSR